MLHLNVEKNSNLYLVKYTSMGQCIIILLNIDEISKWAIEPNKKF